MFNKFALFLLLFISHISPANAFSFTETYVPDNFYSKLSSSDTSNDIYTRIAVIRDSSDNSLYLVGPGESLKIKLPIPVGVRSFGASMQVSHWISRDKPGVFKYAKSMSDYPNDSSYSYQTRSSYPFQFVNTSFDSSDVPIAVVTNEIVEEAGKMGYMLIKNTTKSDALKIITVSVQFTVDKDYVDEYNNWVEAAYNSGCLVEQINRNGDSHHGNLYSDSSCFENISSTVSSEPPIDSDIPETFGEPYNLEEFSNVLESSVYLGEHKEVITQIADDFAPVILFDPEVISNNPSAPEELGVVLSYDNRSLWMNYSDGKSQRLYPTVPNPEKFIIEFEHLLGAGFEYDKNGTFVGKYNNTWYRFHPEYQNSIIETTSNKELTKVEFSEDEEGIFVLNYQYQLNHYRKNEYQGEPGFSSLKNKVWSGNIYVERLD